MTMIEHTNGQIEVLCTQFYLDTFCTACTIVFNLMFPWKWNLYFWLLSLYQTWKVLQYYVIWLGILLTIQKKNRSLFGIGNHRAWCVHIIVWHRCCLSKSIRGMTNGILKHSKVNWLFSLKYFQFETWNPLKSVIGISWALVLIFSQKVFRIINLKYLILKLFHVEKILVRPSKNVVWEMIIMKYTICHSCCNVE
jgi:hypothetical protein